MKLDRFKFLIVGIFLLVLLSVSVSGQSDKSRYKRDGDLMSFDWKNLLFSVVAPGEEILNRDLQAVSDGSSEGGFQVMWSHGRSSNMIVVMHMKNDGLTQRDMDNGVSVSIRRQEGKIVESRKITAGTLNGTEFRATFPNGMIAITRNFYVEPVGFSVMAMFPPESKVEADGIAFLDSLKISAVK